MLILVGQLILIHIAVKSRCQLVEVRRILCEKFVDERRFIYIELGETRRTGFCRFNNLNRRKFDNLAEFIH